MSMKISTVITGGIALLALIFSIVAINIDVPEMAKNLAGVTNFDILDVTDGYRVDGTTIIDENGNIDGAITSTTGTFSSTVSVAERFTYGGGWFSTSTTGVLTQAQMLANSGIYITAAGAGQAVLSLTLPATSTMTTLIPTAGDCTSWVVDASDVAAGTTTTFVKGAGWDLVGLDATGAGTGADVLDGAEFGMITACRQVDTDVIGYLTEWIAAD